MAESPKEKLASLQERVEQQRNTIEALKREGQACPDAERQLGQLLVELHKSEKASSAQA